MIYSDNLSLISESLPRLFSDWAVLFSQRWISALNVKYACLCSTVPVIFFQLWFGDWRWPGRSSRRLARTWSSTIRAKQNKRAPSTLFYLSFAKTTAENIHHPKILEPKYWLINLKSRKTRTVFIYIKFICMLRIYDGRKILVVLLSWGRLENDVICDRKHRNQTWKGERELEAWSKRRRGGRNLRAHWEKPSSCH